MLKLPCIATRVPYWQPWMRSTLAITHRTRVEIHQLSTELLDSTHMQWVDTVILNSIPDGSQQAALAHSIQTLISSPASAFHSNRHSPTNMQRPACYTAPTQPPVLSTSTHNNALNSHQHTSIRNHPPPPTVCSYATSQATQHTVLWLPPISKDKGSLCQRNQAQHVTLALLILKLVPS
jgi:hypothetical protein